MFDFMRLVGEMYVVYKNGVRLNDVPIVKSQLCDFLCSLPWSNRDMLTVEAFYK